MPGVLYMEFMFENSFPKNVEANFAFRRVLMTDVARFIAASWKKPQDVNSSFKEELRQSYTKALEVLLSHLPSRFHPLIQQCLDSMESILSLPMIISHWDLNALNFLVGPTTCHLTGIIDWVDSEICSFGKHLDDLYNLTGTMHTKNGWRNYDDQGSGVLHGNHHE